MAARRVLADGITASPASTKQIGLANGFAFKSGRVQWICIFICWRNRRGRGIASPAAVLIDCRVHSTRDGTGGMTWGGDNLAHVAPLLGSHEGNNCVCVHTLGRRRCRDLNSAPRPPTGRPPTTLHRAPRNVASVHHVPLLIGGRCDASLAMWPFA